MAPIAGVMLLSMVGAAGVGLDYSRMVSIRTKMQSAVDAAVVAGLRAADQNQRDAAATQMFNSVMTGTTAQISGPAFSTTTEGYYRITASAVVPMYLSAFMQPSVRTVSVASAGFTKPTTSNVCILVLDSNATQSLLVNSGASINGPDCEIHVRSNANPAVIYNAGTDFKIRSLCTKGKILFNTTKRPPYEENCNTTEDPFTGNVLPNPQKITTCTYNNQTWNPSSSITVNPGAWCGWNNFNGASTIKFNPGFYTIRGGGITVNSGSTVIADGVTFYFEDASTFTMNGSVKLTFKAPTTGTYAYIAMYEKQGLSQSPFVFNGINGQEMNGLFYLPSRNVTMNSTSSVNSEQISLVVNRLILNSTAWSISAISDTQKRIIRKDPGTPVGGIPVYSGVILTN